MGAWGTEYTARYTTALAFEGSHKASRVYPGYYLGPTRYPGYSIFLYPRVGG